MGRPKNGKKVPCLSCGKKIYVCPSQTKKKVCSMACTPKGLLSAKWRGGKSTSNGYLVVYCPGHPHPKFGNYVYEHRLVMEKKIGRFLKNGEIVHHKNEIKTDNRIENLDLTNRSEHNRHHLKNRYKYKTSKKNEVDHEYELAC